MYLQPAIFCVILVGLCVLIDHTKFKARREYFAEIIARQRAFDRIEEIRSRQLSEEQMEAIRIYLGIPTIEKER